MSGVESASGRVFALTICAYRKPGMTEEAYHRHLSEKHAPLLTDLMAENKIIDYTMQHNTSETRELMGQLFAKLPEHLIADYDAFIHIVFKDVQDFLNVTNDPHYKQVVVPDHRNFADHERTTMVTGWLETHIVGGKVVSAEPGIKTNGSLGHEVQGAD